MAAFFKKPCTYINTLLAPSFSLFYDDQSTYEIKINHEEELTSKVLAMSGRSSSKRNPVQPTSRVFS